MFCLTLIISSVSAEEFQKTICACVRGHCDSFAACNKQPTIDPSTRTFLDDFNTLRRNVKNISLIFNNKEDLSVRMDMRSISGIKINFRSSAKVVNISLTYVNNDNYGGNYFGFDRNCNPSFIPIQNEATNNVLMIGSIDAKQSIVSFHKNGDKNTEIKFNSLLISTSSLSNISALTKENAGETYLNIGDHDTLEVKFMKTYLSITMNETKLSYSYRKGDSVTITGKYKFETSTATDTLKISIDEGVTYQDIPSISLGNITNIEFYGKWWAPSETIPLGEIKYIASIVFPPGDFPFSIFTDKFNATVIDNTTIHGDVDAVSSFDFSTYMYITTEKKETVSAHFMGFFDGAITPRSPYIYIELENLTINETYIGLDSFPINCAFNEKAHSFVHIKTIYYNTPKLIKKTFNAYADLQRIYSDEDLLDLPVFKKGFHFFDLPPNSFSVNVFTLYIDKESPSIGYKVPGFTPDNVCIGAILERTDRDRMKVAIVKSAYGNPVYICLTSGTSKCKNPPGISHYPFKDVTATENVDLSEIVDPGYKTIIISTLASGTNFNCDNLVGTNFSISINGSSATSIVTQVTIKDTYKKINNIKLSYINLIDSFAFNVNTATLLGVKFTKEKSYTFGISAKVTADPNSIDSLNSVTQDTRFDALTIVFNKDYLPISYINGFTGHEELIDIDNSIAKICFRAKKSSVYTSYCASINPKYINDFNIKSTYPLTITVSSFSQNFNSPSIDVNPAISYLYKINLKGDGWGTPLDKKFIIDNGNKKINIYVNKPGQAENIKLGSKKALINVDYGKAIEYCIYKDSTSTSSCYKKTTIKNKIQYSSSASTEIASIANDSVSINFDYSTDDVIIPISFFNEKKVSLASYSSLLSIKEVIIDINNTQLNKFYSLTTFNNIITLYNKTEDTTVTFGQLVLSGKYDVNQNWKDHVSLVVSQLTCTYNQLYMFKKITVDDQIIITGDIPAESKEIEIDFIPDDEANDVIADIKGDVTIIVNKDSLKVGNITYNIKHSDNNDALFKIKSESNITIISNVNNKLDLTKFTIEISSGYNANITFVGQFPKIDEDEKAYIKLTGSQKVNITTSSYLPVTIEQFYDVKIHYLANVKEIHGPIQYNPNRYSDGPRIKIYNDQPEKMFLDIINGIDIFDQENNKKLHLIGAMSANLVINIRRVNPMSDTYKPTFFLTNTISQVGASKLVFASEIGPQCKFNSETYVRSKVIGNIQNEDTFPFISTNESIIEAKETDILPVNFNFVYVVDKEDKLAHGFYPGVNCLSIKTNRIPNDSYAVELYAEIRPSQIPFIIDFVGEGEVTDGEFIINDDNIADFGDLKKILPSLYTGIILRLYRDMDQDHPLNLESLKANAKSIYVTVQSMAYEPFEAYVTIPADKSINLIFENLVLDFIVAPGKSNNVVAKFINFTDCEFPKKDSFVLSNEVEAIMMDVDSLNELVTTALKKYKNKLTVNSANVILFTKDGWEFREDRARSTTPIKASDIENIVFETDRFCLLQIEDETLTSIHSFKFNAIPQSDGAVYFEIGRNWGRIQNLDNFLINVNNATKVSLISASYPIPKLFNISNSNISYTFDQDVHGEFDIITLDNGLNFKDEIFSADFQFLLPKYRFVKGEKVIFSGNTQIIFKNDIGAVQLAEAVFSENANSSFTNLEILKQMTVLRNSTVQGKIKFSYSSKLTLHWKIDEIPLIVLNEYVDGVPQTLELIYDDSTVDIETYNQKLKESGGIIIMKGDFNCNQMAKQVTYGGKYLPFGDHNTVLGLTCDTSSDGQVLLLNGVRDIIEDNNDDSQSGSKDAKISSSGIAGIVIGCAIVIGVICALAVYYVQRVKIDKLKNQIPAEKTDAYKSSQYETRESETSSAGITHSDIEDAFDEV